MCKALNKLENQGIQKGISQGQSLAARLFEFLVKNNKMDEFHKSCADIKYQNKLIKKYKIKC